MEIQKIKDSTGVFQIVAPRHCESCEERSSRSNPTSLPYGEGLGL